MSNQTITLPGLDDYEAYNLVRDALYEWATKRGGKHPHRWAEDADELAASYVARRYPREDPEGRPYSCYSEQFCADKRAHTARKLRALCGFKMSPQAPQEQENTVATESTGSEPEAAPITEFGTSGWMTPMEPHRGADPIPEYAKARTVYYRLNVPFESNHANALAALIRPIYSDVSSEVREFAGAHFDIPRHLVGWIFMVKAPGDGAVVVTGQTAGTEAGFQLARQCCQAALGHGDEERGYLVLQLPPGEVRPSRVHVLFARNGADARAALGCTWENREQLKVSRALPRDVRAWFRGFPNPT